jgi:hypothetical protein
MVLVQHEEGGKADYHAEHGAKPCTDLLEAGGARFAYLNWHLTLHQDYPRHREQHGQRNDQDAQDRCGHLCQQACLPFSP